jgi:amidase
VILGKTNLPVGLADWQSVNPNYGRTSNPFDLTRSPGGSSGGSAAALAAGMVPLEYGSDIGGSIRVPAAFCGVFGHKPSFDLIPSRGHQPPGVEGAGLVMAVVGPMARTAGDLALALDVLAGPDRDQAVAYRLALPASRHERLADFRVLMIESHPAAGVDGEIRAALGSLAQGLEKLGARVDRSSERLPDLAKAHELYMGMLNTAMARKGPDPSAASATEWLTMLDRQYGVRQQWAALFETYDVVLAPNRGTVAFPHNDEPDGDKRTVLIDGQPTPYYAQLAWPGMATLANLPATAAPFGATRDGLPIGVQIIGPYLEDRTTLAFAGLIEREFGGFRPPPGL